MCGIAGIFDSRSAKGQRENCFAMISKLRHRGPDGSGVWSDDECGIALGHARLSILDLTDAGSQPMQSRSGRWIISFNGEIYNFSEIRMELQKKGVGFRGRSDTEVLIEAIDLWGFEKVLTKLIGMFAISLWDRLEKTIYLARDHLGIKPLYWSYRDDRFLFGSELKALKAYENFCDEIDQSALTGFFRYGYVPGSMSIYKGVHKLQPGHYLSWNPGSGDPVVTNYWSLESVAFDSNSSIQSMSDQDAVMQLHQLLRDAVTKQMISDVPLGALLSGGVDSSLVVALMQSASTNPIETFSVGFHDSKHNEAKFAAAVASHLGTRHTELYVDAQDALDLVNKIPDWYDEPFADSSQIPTYLVAALTRNHVTVALSGDGGDELFGGYNRYSWANSIWKFNRKVPPWLRKRFALGIQSFSPVLLNSFSEFFPKKIFPPQFADKMYKLSRLILAPSENALYFDLVSCWTNPASLVVAGEEPESIMFNSGEEIQSFTSRMQYLDTLTYLPDDILTKVDRASMAVSLETRIPLLDHRIAEFAWTQPEHRKIRGRESKWLLRQVLYEYVPKNLIERPKMGFSVPLASWLRGPLREWAEDLLAPSKLKTQGFLNSELVEKSWQEHLSGYRNWQHRLWAVLMFQLWLQQQR